MKKVVLLIMLTGGISFASNANNSDVFMSKKALLMPAANKSFMLFKPLKWVEFTISGCGCAAERCITIDDEDVESAKALINFAVDQQLAIAAGC